MSSFDSFSLRRWARMISCTLRFMLRSGVSRRFLITCCVIVDPPCALRPRSTLVMNARAMPM